MGLVSVVLFVGSTGCARKARTLLSAIGTDTKYQVERSIAYMSRSSEEKWGAGTGCGDEEDDAG